MESLGTQRVRWCGGWSRLWTLLLVFASIAAFNFLLGGVKRFTLQASLSKEQFKNCAPTFGNEILLSSLAWLGLGIGVYALFFLAVWCISLWRENQSANIRFAVALCPSENWKCSWPSSSRFYLCVALCSLAALCVMSQFITAFALLPKSRVGNFLSDYATHVSLAATCGKSMYFIMPFFSEHFISRLPQYISRHEIQQHCCREETPRFEYCRYSHEYRETHMWEVLPLMRVLLQRALQLPHPQPVPVSHHTNISVTCAIHLRLDDILSIVDRQYPLVAYSWYHQALAQAEPPCTHINFVSRAAHLSSNPSLTFAYHTSVALQAAFLQQIQHDFPAAMIEVHLHGSIDDDMRLLASSDLFLGSSSTFSLWAGVACVGTAFLPQTPLLFNGETVVLRSTPLLAISAAPTVNSTWLAAQSKRRDRDAIIRAVMQH